MSASDSKANELRTAIAALESRRFLLGDAVVEPAIAALRKQLSDLQTPVASAPGEERKVVTTMFVDVSGFTALAEKLDPEEVRGIINGCFDQLVPIVQKYDGTVDKFIGDEIMALFGAPVAHENDPERALRAALEMMESISAFNQQQNTSLSLHIGINTGPVVTGAIGSKDRKDYSVMGDSVNLAARLEQSSADGEIYVGPNTYRLTNAIFDFDALPPLALKGKTEPVPAYRLNGLKAVPNPTRGIEGLRSDLIGREGELAKIGDIMRRLRGGTGGILAVVGEAGVGKSRLVSEALVTLADDLRHAEGRALSHTTGMSYWMVRNLLGALIGIGEGSSADEIASALRRSVESVAPSAFREIYPYLATLLQLHLDDDLQERVKFLSTEALHGRILQAAKDYIVAEAMRQPLVLFLEDLHWADPSSLRIVEALFSSAEAIPLLIVLAYRPEEEATEQIQKQAHTSGGENFHLIELSPLSRQQSGSLVENLLEIDNLPRRMRDLVVERADGNPFFIEELLRSLLDSGVVTVHDGRVLARGDIEQVPVPETVEGVLTARMDRLSASDKAALQTAAVIGRMFQRSVLERVISTAELATLGTSLDELQRRDFIRRAKNGGARNGYYMFKHAITQDVAYHALLRSRRKQVHHQVGEALEELYPHRLTELSPTLGYHFEKAEQREKAFRYLRQAGERAQAVFANTEAEAFYRSAIRHAVSVLETAPDANTIRELSQVHELLGDILKLVGRSDEARASYAESLRLVPAGNRVGRSRLQRKIGAAYTIQRRFTAMTDAFDDADRELGTEPVEPAAEWWNEKMQVLLERMHLCYWQGMSEEMMQLAARYRNDIEQRGTPVQRGLFFQRLSLSHLTRDRYVASEESERLMELAVSTSNDSDDLAARAHILFTAGLTQLYRANLSQSIGHFDAALGLGERVGDRIVQARCLTYMAVAYRRSGHIRETRSYAERTRTLAGELVMVEYVAMAEANLSWVAWRENRLLETHSLGSDALKLWHSMDDPYGVDWLALLPMLAAATAEKRFDVAIECTKGLFGENQHPLPEKLVTAAQDVLADSPRAETAMIEARLHRLIEVAQEIGYL